MREGGARQGLIPVYSSVWTPSRWETLDPFKFWVYSHFNVMTHDHWGLMQLYSWGYMSHLFHNCSLSCMHQITEFWSMHALWSVHPPGDKAIWRNAATAVSIYVLVIKKRSTVWEIENCNRLRPTVAKPSPHSGQHAWYSKGHYSCVQLAVYTCSYHVTVHTIDNINHDIILQ